MALAARKNTLREMFLQADRIVALSQFQRRMMVAHGFPAERVEHVPHGVETAPLERAARKRRTHPPAEAGKIVFIGTLAMHKGPHVLLEAFRRAPDLRITLELVGGDGAEPAYGRHLRDLAGSDPRISFRGQVPEEMLGEILQDASVLALPALWYENDPLVVKAALHCGVPVAVSDIGSLSEMVTPDTGWLLPVGDADAWAAWLREVARQPVRVLPDSLPVPTAEAFAERMFSIYFESL
jgi:glycosyltransferase involved in cell wall biosynthesis